MNLDKRFSRRRALSTVAKVAIGAGVAVAAAGGVAAYFATRPPQVIEKVVTSVVERPVERTVVTTVAGVPTTVLTTVKETETVVLSPTTPTVKKPFEVWWSMPIFDKEKELITKLSDEFAKKHGVEVKLTFFPHHELDVKMLPSLEAGTLPDVIWQVHQNYMTPLFERGALMDVSDIINELGRDRIVKGVLDVVTMKGITYCIPHYMYAMSYLHYRKDLFAEVGYTKPPETIEEFEDALIKIQKRLPEKTWAFGLSVGEAAQYDAHLAIEQIIWVFGGRAIDENQKVVLNSSETIKAVEWIAKMWKQGTIPPASASWTAWDNNDYYQTEKIATVMNPTGSIMAWCRANKPDLYKKSGTMRWPKGPEGKTYLSVGQYGFYINKATEYPDLAKEFVKSFYEKEFYFELAKTTAPYFFPIFSDMLEDPFYKGEEQLWEMASQFLDPTIEKRTTGYAGGYTAAWGETLTMNILPHMILRVVLGDWTAEAAVKEAHSRMDTIYKRYYP